MLVRVATTRALVDFLTGAKKSRLRGAGADREIGQRPGGAKRTRLWIWKTADDGRPGRAWRTNCPSKESANARTVTDVQAV